MVADIAVSSSPLRWGELVDLYAVLNEESCEKEVELEEKDLQSESYKRSMEWVESFMQMSKEDKEKYFEERDREIYLNRMSNRI